MVLRGSHSVIRLESTTSVAVNQRAVLFIYGSYRTLYFSLHPLEPSQNGLDLVGPTPVACSLSLRSVLSAERKPLAGQ